MAVWAVKCARFLDNAMTDLVFHLAGVSTGIMLLIAATHDADLW